MMLGRKIKFFVDLCFERLLEEKESEYIFDYLYELEEKVEKNYEYVSENLQIFVGKIKENYDNKMNFKKYEKGDEYSLV